MGPSLGHRIGHFFKKKKKRINLFLTHHYPEVLTFGHRGRQIPLSNLFWIMESLAQLTAVTPCWAGEKMPCVGLEESKSGRWKNSQVRQREAWSHGS